VFDFVLDFDFFFFGFCMKIYICCTEKTEEIWRRDINNLPAHTDIPRLGTKMKIFDGEVSFSLLFSSLSLLLLSFLFLFSHFFSLLLLLFLIVMGREIQRWRTFLKTSQDTRWSKNSFFPLQVFPLSLISLFLFVTEIFFSFSFSQLSSLNQISSLSFSLSLSSSLSPSLPSRRTQ